MAWINLVPSATATRASNEHLAVVEATLIAAGTEMQAASQDR
ncbi:MAG TPA: hypothetical protein VLM11_20440 [Streptosporangiaceae bacterium]|nr:hypothetical protein [Streptosporangiaceae bacterium]